MAQSQFLSPVETSILFEKMFKNAVSTSIIVLDLGGKIIDVNQGMQKSFGYSRDSLIGKNFSLLFIEEDKLKQLPEKELEETVKSGSYSDENYILTSDGFPTWVHGESILTEAENGKQYIIKVIHETHTKKLLKEELMKKNEEQEKIIKDRDIFIHTVSHDLKSPISNMEGLVNSLKGTNHDPEELELTIKMLDQSMDRLKSKINELAVTGKEQEEKKIAATNLEFHEELTDVLLDLKEEINRSEAEIISDFSKAPVINFSKKNLKSILQNMVSNSMKFRSPNRKPKVVIDTDKFGDEFIVLRIRDNGLGIKEKDKEKIFRMYHRLNTSIKGTGVGMAIVKRMVENSGGKIELESILGEGSTFKILLPSSA